jgi:hypothetical protein
VLSGGWGELRAALRRRWQLTVTIRRRTSRSLPVALDSHPARTMLLAPSHPTSDALDIAALRPVDRDIDAGMSGGVTARSSIGRPGGRARRSRDRRHGRAVVHRAGGRAGVCLSRDRERCRCAYSPYVVCGLHRVASLVWSLGDLLEVHAEPARDVQVPDMRDVQRVSVRAIWRWQRRSREAKAHSGRAGLGLVFEIERSV